MRLFPIQGSQGGRMRCLEKSNEHFRRAIDKLPLGVSSNFRYWGENKTIYIRQGKGARIRDFDDNEYIDYRLAYGPIILGYADPRVDAAARAGEVTDMDFSTVAADLARRDALDSGRQHDPLTRADGAVEVDTSHLTIDEVVELIAAEITG